MKADEITIRVSYFKNILSSDGHAFNCVQHELEIEASTPIEALGIADEELKSLHIAETAWSSVEVLSSTDQERQLASSQEAHVAPTRRPECRHVRIVF